MLDYKPSSSDPIATTTERTLQVIEFILATPEGVSPQDILLQVDISRSTLFLLLRTLKNLGYIEQIERRGRYRIGPRLQSWRASPGDTRQELLSAFFRETSRRNWSETLILAVPASGGSLVYAQAESNQQVRSVYNTGEVLPDLKPVQLVLDLHPSDSVLENGYALVESAELLEVALPVCPNGSRPEAAILLSAPAFRWIREKLIDTLLPELRAMAARLSYRLGALTYTPYNRQTQDTLPPAAPLSPREITSFLQGPWTARLACIRPDGSPHVIPVWQEWDGSAFSIIAWQGSQWADFVLANPAISLTIDEPWPPLRRVTARGKAELLPISTDHPQLEQLIQRFYQRYLGQLDPGRNAGQVQSAFRIHIDYIRGWQGVPAPASK